MTTRPNPKKLREQLTPAQWLALDHLYQQEAAGKFGQWTKTDARCPAATARALRDHGAVYYEQQLMLRGPEQGTVRKRVKLKGVARRLVELGPPPAVAQRLPEGARAWDILRRI